MRKIPFLALAFAALCFSASAEPATVAQWVQYAPAGALEARAVVASAANAECPQAVIDGKPAQMLTRAPADANFPQICGIAVPAGAKTLLIAKQPLALPVAEPTRIMVFGDTGCRIKGKAVQNCADPAKWPFPVIAAEAAKLKPDLVIHVGDYLYREEACPADHPGCAGTPYGDNWPTWDADFFTPAQPLLAAAPWVFVRGNHEDCSRAGPGWLRLLGPLPYDPSAPCIVHLALYSVPIGSVNLAVLDDTAAPDTSVADSLVPALRQDMDSLADDPKPTWLLMHRPIWGAVTGPLGLPVGGNATMIDAIGYSGIAEPVVLQLAGHIHTFEAINFRSASPVPPLVIAGFGGDKLDPTPANLAGTVFQGRSGVTVKDGLSIGGFGFLILTKTAHGWRIDVHDVKGALERQCLFHNGRVDCPKPH